MEALKDDDGIWVLEEEKIQNMIASFFRNLYSKDELDELIPFPLRGVFPGLMNLDSRILIGT